MGQKRDYGQKIKGILCRVKIDLFSQKNTEIFEPEAFLGDIGGIRVAGHPFFEGLFSSMAETPASTSGSSFLYCPFSSPIHSVPTRSRNRAAPLLWFCMGLVMRKQGTNALHCLFCGQAGRDLLSLPGLKAAVPAKEHGPAFRSPYDTDIPDPALPAAPRAAGDANLDLAREILAGVLIGNRFREADRILRPVLAERDTRAGLDVPVRRV